LIACILSASNPGHDDGPRVDRLFAEAATPESMLKLTLVASSASYIPSASIERRHASFLGICHDLLHRFAGRVPDTIDDLLTLNGVGRKTANLVVTMG